MFGSVFNKKFDLKDEIAELYEDLRAIDATKEMVSCEGWVMLRTLIIEKIVSYDSNIVTLAANPTKYATEMNYKHALRTALKEILSAVDNTLNYEQEVRAKLKKREEIARLDGTQ